METATVSGDLTLTPSTEDFLSNLSTTVREEADRDHFSPLALGAIIVSIVVIFIIVLVVNILCTCKQVQSWLMTRFCCKRLDHHGNDSVNKSFLSTTTTVTTNNSLCATSMSTLNLYSSSSQRNNQSTPAKAWNIGCRSPILRQNNFTRDLELVVAEPPELQNPQAFNNSYKTERPLMSSFKPRDLPNGDRPMASEGVDLLSNHIRPYNHRRISTNESEVCRHCQGFVTNDTLLLYETVPKHYHCIDVV